MSLAIKASKARAGNVTTSIGAAAVRRVGNQGDPGLFGFLGKAAGFIGSAITGGVAGAVGSIAGAIAQQTNPPAGPGAVSFPTTGGFFPTPPILISPIQQTPGIGDRLRVAGQALVPGGVEPFGMNGGAGGCAVGFHVNKSDYFLKDGTFIQKGTVCVKNRRRNPLNPRAASRAIGRIEAAKKATSRLDRISIKCNRCKKARCTC